MLAKVDFKFSISRLLITFAVLLSCSLSFSPSPSFSLHASVTNEYFHVENQPYFVGELGAAWQFPSDHLPIGLTVGRFHISSWNTLNKDYLHYIQANQQGLRDSSILEENVLLDHDCPLTLRELNVANIVMEMITHPTHPRSLVALQETNRDLQNYLSEQIPSGWVIVTSHNQEFSQVIFLYDSAIFNLIAIDSVSYSESVSKSILTLTLEEKATGHVFRFLQSHIPGGPNSKEGGEIFSKEALRLFDPSITTVLMGDMNQLSGSIDDALMAASKAKGLLSSPYAYVPVNYPTHIDTHACASWIDHFFVYAADNELDINEADKAEEVSRQVVHTVRLLESIKE